MIFYRPDGNVVNSEFPDEIKNNPTVKEYIKLSMDKTVAIAMRRNKQTNEWESFSDEEIAILNAKAKLLPDFSWKKKDKDNLSPQDEENNEEQFSTTRELERAEELLRELRAQMEDNRDDD